MAKLNLSKTAWDTLVKVCEQEKITHSEFVSRLIDEFATRLVDEPPMHRCAFCNLGYYSQGNLEWHIKKRHANKAVIKR